MKKSLIWITAGFAGIGFAIPAYASMSSQNDAPVTTPAATVESTPKSVVSAATTPSRPLLDPFDFVSVPGNTGGRFS